MEPLDRDEVRQIAKLARLSLSDDECDQLAAELTDILGHFTALADLEAGEVEPMTHAVPMQLRLRDDTVLPSLSVEEAVGDAPDRDDDLFRVPEIISGSDS